MKKFRLLANTIAVLHGIIVVIIIIVVILGITKINYPVWLKNIGFAIAVSSLASYIFFQNCPLTLLERYLREKDGQKKHIYSHSGFVEYYCKKFFGIKISDNIVMILSGIFSIIIFISIIFYNK